MTFLRTDYKACHSLIHFFVISSGIPNQSIIIESLSKCMATIQKFTFPQSRMPNFRTLLCNGRNRTDSREKDNWHVEFSRPAEQTQADEEWRMDRKQKK
jgi:hypothetical protein